MQDTLPALTSSGLAWLLVMAAGLSSSIGNLLLKQSRRAATDEGLTALLASPWFLGGLAFFCLNLVLFAKGLDRLPVSAAYPVMVGVNFAVVTFAAAWLFQERLSLGQYTGLGVILLGFVLLMRS